MKKLIALILCLSALVLFAGCGNKDEKKPEKPEKEVATQPQKPKNEAEAPKEEEQDPVEKAKADIVGTWVVTKTEVYNTSLKALAEQITNTYFYVGSEHEFTADGVYKNSDGTLTTNYSIIDENHITLTDVGSGDSSMYDYELNGDEYVQYGIYTDTSGNVGHSNAVYFKRK